MAKNIRQIALQTREAEEAYRDRGIVVDEKKNQVHAEFNVKELEERVQITELRAREAEALLRLHEAQEKLRARRKKS
jgi:hypothetical protein